MMNKSKRVVGATAYISPTVEVFTMQIKGVLSASVELDGGWNDNTTEFNFGE